MELLYAFIFGAVFGSFLNVLIVRIPKEQSVVFNSSHCIKCNASLKPWHNIPLLSWIFLRAKCAYCRESISPRYFIVELLSAIVALLLVYKFSFSFATIFVVASFFMLLSLSVIDIEHQMVPDSLNLLAIVFAIIGASSITQIAQNFSNALLIAGGFTLLRFAISYVLTKIDFFGAKNRDIPWCKNYQTYAFMEALGEGDIMVAATMGALLGVELSLVAIFLSSLLALPVMLYIQISSREKRVAYVPFLALATFLVYFFSLEFQQFLTMWLGGI